MTKQRKDKLVGEMATKVAEALKSGNDDEAIAILIKYTKELAHRMAVAMDGIMEVDENEYAMRIMAAQLIATIKDLKKRSEN